MLQPCGDRWPSPSCSVSPSRWFSPSSSRRSSCTAIRARNTGKKWLQQHRRLARAYLKDPVSNFESPALALSFLFYRKHARLEHRDQRLMPVKYRDLSLGRGYGHRLGVAVKEILVDLGDDDSHFTCSIVPFM